MQPEGWVAIVLLSALVAACLLWCIRRFVHWTRHRSMVARSSKSTRHAIMRQIDTCIMMCIADPEDDELKNELDFLIGVLRRRWH